MVIWAVTVLLVLSVAWTSAKPAQQVHLRRVQEASPPNGTSLSASEYEGLIGLLGNGTTRLASLYRTSEHGTSYDDLIDRVGDAKPLVFVVRKDQYVFGAFISAGLRLPDDPASYHRVECDVWHFSLAGHFPQPTKIEIEQWEHYVEVAGGQRSVAVGGPSVYIGGVLWVKAEYDVGVAADDVLYCKQLTRSVPEGYTGVSTEYGTALLAGWSTFMADEIEVLHVVGWGSNQE